MTRLETAIFLSNRRGHTGQRHLDFITGYMIAHHPGHKGSIRHTSKFGRGRRSRPFRTHKRKI